MTRPHVRIRASVTEADGMSRTLAFEGQEARTLRALVEAGERGVTSLEISTWALRTSHYIFKLRRAGLTIETIREPHDGPVPGKHGRYVLRSRVCILEPLDQRAAAA
jgi:hypothetical protein